jgi:ankyrin repeat protein
MWAGADPRSIGPAWGDEEGFDESEYSSALIQAAYSKNVEILKRLKPDVKKDKLDHLLTSAAAFGRVDVVRYLLELGAKPNDKANGGSSSLDRCLSTSLGFRGFRYDSYFGTPAKASKYSVSDSLDTLRLLFEHGAQWRPDEGR